MIGERIEGRLDLLLIVDLAALGTECLKKGATEWVAGEEPVQVAPGDSAVAADAAIGTTSQAEHRPLELGSGRAAEMHLVALDCHAGRKLDAGGLGKSLGGVEYGVDLEQPEPLDGFPSPFRAEAIRDGAPQHLIAAAEAEDAPALAPMSQKIDVPPLAAQEFEITDRGLRPRQNHQRGISRQRPPGRDHD